MRRGEIWLVKLDPTIGSEIRKTRPCLIISPDELNHIKRRVIGAPLSSGSHPAPFRISTTFRDRSGLILLDQIRTVDRQRCVGQLGNADRAELEEVLAVLSGLFAI